MTINFTTLAKPCAPDGSFLEEPITTPKSPPELEAPETTSEGGPWAPFPDRLAFDWAHYHYVRLQSSADDIHVTVGLDLWLATIIKHESKHGQANEEPSDGETPEGVHKVHWRNAEELYATIDSIPAGGIGWKSYKFSYNGPKPFTPPRWMEEMYDLNTRDVLALFEQQLSSTEFDSEFEDTPFEEFNSKGNRVYSHLMSAYWANREAVRTYPLVTSFQVAHMTIRTQLQKIGQPMGPCWYP
jgi:Plavaka transposase